MMLFLQLGRGAVASHTSKWQEELATMPTGCAGVSRRSAGARKTEFDVSTFLSSKVRVGVHMTIGWSSLAFNTTLAGDSSSAGSSRVHARFPAPTAGQIHIIQSPLSR